MRVSKTQVLYFVHLFFLWGSASHGWAREGNFEETFIMGALGDSVTRAVNSTGWGDKAQYSWSTGSSTDGTVESHYLKLKKNYKNVKAYNYAVSGARADDLASQVKNLLPYKPDYVTLMIGANDACAWPEGSDASIQHYADTVEKTITSLVLSNNDMKILLIPIPNMLQLQKVGKENGCQSTWNIFRICPNLLHSSRTDAERSRFRDRIDTANDELVRISKKFPHNVKFNIGLASAKFEKEHISSRDCFHPSGEGQSLISEVTWMTGWFAD